MNDDRRDACPVIGQVIGDVKVLEQVSEGPLGRLYVGDHLVLSRKVLLRALPEDISQAAKDAFARGAAALARLDHPQVVRVLDSRDLAEGRFIVSELPGGETLARWLEAREPDRDRTERIVVAVVQVLRALHYAHQHGILHAGLTPSNVVLGPDGVATVADCGITGLVGRSNVELVNDGTLGTLNYRSREQLLGKPLDARSDIYSVGVMLYEATTGHLPFEIEDKRALLKSIVKDSPTPPSRHRPEIGERLEKVILKAIAPWPAFRFASAEAMARELEALGNASSLEAALRAAAFGGSIPHDLEVKFSHALVGSSTITIRADGSFQRVRHFREDHTSPWKEEARTGSVRPGALRELVQSLVELEVWSLREPECPGPPDTEFTYACVVAAGERVEAHAGLWSSDPRVSEIGRHLERAAADLSLWEKAKAAVAGLLRSFS